MPRPGPAMDLVGVRLPTADIILLDGRALLEGRTDDDGQPNRSAMARVLIAYALAEMPIGWTP